MFSLRVKIVNSARAIAVLSLVSLLPATCPSAYASDRETDIAITYTLSDAVVWEPLINYVTVTLNVTGPDGEVTSQVFGAHEEPVYAPSNPIDGPYVYELVFQTITDQGERINSNEAGLEPSVASLSHSGVFTVSSGNIVEQGPESANDSDGAFGTRDVVVVDDHIVRGSECVGLDCINGENFGFDTLRLKENNLQIHFDDSSNSGSFPFNDWRILINESANGGANKFAIQDATAGRIPFTIMAGAIANALFVDAEGDVGIGTANPVVEVHAVDGNTPTLRLDQDASNGFTPQVWDLAGNEANFFIRDVTNGSNLPFKLRPGAPENSLTIAPDGNVGMGTNSPAARLHVRTTDAAHLDLARFENTSLTNPNVNLELVSGDENWTIGINGAQSKLELKRASDSLFSIDGKTRMVVANYGIKSGGVIHHASDRNMKDSFKEIEPVDILDKVLELRISQWKFKSEENGVRHIGPTSQDFGSAFGVGTDDRFIDTVDADGVALAAIQGLNRKLMQSLEERDAVINTLLKRIEALEQATVEAAATPESNNIED